MNRVTGAAVLVVWLSSAGCSEGYPPKETPVDPAQDMTLAERLDRMNALGAQADPDVRWRYTLPDPCELGVVAEVAGEDTVAVALALNRPLDFEGIDESDGGFGVSVETVSGAVTALFSSERWPDAVEMRYHLQALRRQACPPLTAPAASAPAF
jgi:hypothetical protein